MASMILRHLISAFFGVLALVILVHAQNQSGFISIDCGMPKDASYTDEITGINYVSDTTFIETGVINNISSQYNSEALELQFFNVRAFPEGTRNCYTLKPTSGNVKFLIRARFMYGNYDGQNIVPSFRLLLDADVWTSVNLQDASTIVTKEIIHIPKRNYIHICLLNTGSGTPFISALELRPLKNSTYETQSGSLLLFGRWDVGSTTNKTIRFQDDVCDRIWSPYLSRNWETISSSSSFLRNDWQLPSTVMRTAVRPANTSNSLEFYWETSNPESKYYVFVHFAEVEVRQANQTREMSIYANGRFWYGPFVPFSFFTTTLISIYPTSGSERIDFSINKTEKSTLPPIFNAIEIYQAKEFPQMLTNQQDVDAIMNIKTRYGVKRNWQGDPCAPKVYLWQGLNCSYDAYEFPRIISLNLSSSGISGEIVPYLFSLTYMQYLDLSNNSLAGPVPQFLSELQFLRVLNLTGNNLEGPVPAGIIEKAKNGLLSLSVDGNPNLCHSASCKEKNKKFIAPVVASVVSVAVLLIALAILWNLKMRKQVGKKKDLFEPKNRKLSYSAVVKITNNFERVIGKGGFGTVFHGYLDDTEVAVKMLSTSSVQGYKQFQAEVELLMRVHHKNLTTLVAYCDEGTNMGLIYEFMANGNLESHLSENGTSILKWEVRLRIATEAAQGLEYLHIGCKPPIVHRDVKSTNILLNEKFQAKLADFGLSRIFPVESGTHVSTTIAGTPGYLDPEYYVSTRLTEKSDVYSFGVVLLEIITSKPVIERTHERTHISQWVSFMLSKGDIKNIVDPRLQGDFDINSVWKVVEIAMTCVSPMSTKRPTMNQVVMELNEALAIEIASTKVDQENESKDYIELMNLNQHSELSPLAR